MRSFKMDNYSLHFIKEWTFDISICSTVTSFDLRKLLQKELLVGTNYLAFSLMPSAHAPPGKKQSGQQSWTSLAFPKSGKYQWDCQIGNYYSKNFLSLHVLSRFAAKYYEKNIARLHRHKSMNKPKKLDLVYRTVFPRERSWVRRQEISLRFAALIHG